MASRKGSSPSVRGKRKTGSPLSCAPRLIPARAGKTQCSPRAAAAAWLIPARAGKTRTRATSPTAPWAHPRACGENSTNHPRPRSSRGSSPRVRGKRLVEFFGRDLARLIPARAGKTPPRPRPPLQPPAHPRTCGENSARSVHRSLASGSSPRVRGKLGEVLPPIARVRLIPARAGKTKTSPQPGPGGTAHPRACGENRRSCTRRPPEPGSSPRVRGKQRWRFRQCQHSRLIPARAGKTRTASAERLDRGAHPRACGENRTACAPSRTTCGSSPRVRGKRDARMRACHRCGLIPARAGKTSTWCSSIARPRAHPRACGENGKLTAQLHEGSGSSPRVRGKLDATGGVTSFFGLIPARAGKTPRPQWLSGRPRAHPRACGENSRTSAPRSDCSGSSPRVRGKLISFSASCGVCGLIPARAGKTLGLTQGQITRRAHPRACGENGRIGVPVSLASGSSPRVRGKRADRCAGLARLGLIPARAGKTHEHGVAVVDDGAHPRACGENEVSVRRCASGEGSSPRVRGKRRLRLRMGRHHGLIPARAGKTSSSRTTSARCAAHPRACGENRP